MPSLSQIQNTFFVNLINRLGVRPPPPEAFLLSNVVQPVSIVDSDITLSAVATTVLCDGVNSAGLLAAPAAGTILADTGAEPAGNYATFIMYSIDGVGTAATTIIIARRNAANNADIWAQIIGLGSGADSTSVVPVQMRIALLLNERLVIRMGAAALAGGSIQASIFIQPST
jgi:hypothetical protein